MKMAQLFTVICFTAIFAPSLAHSAPGEAEAPPADTTIEQFLQNLSTVPNVVERRDPFIAASAPFTAAPQVTGDTVNHSAPVLERYPVSQYGLVATLLGDQYPRALVRLPSSEGNKVVIVKQKDRLGNRSGIITKINRDGLTILETQRSPLGFVDKTEVSLRVGAKGASGPTQPPPQPVPGQLAPGPGGGMPPSNQWNSQ